MPAWFRREAPQALIEANYDEAVAIAMAWRGIDPEVIYAFGKTGLVVIEENKHLVPAT